ncbi:pentatricopeptide repeat-containing protein At5g66520-like isoform X1 [Lycium barbarum]|uniref:pentatricopeptide repeat-containing protein At5g66520-like isoform X1 n=1 Tax=Lycium barbarum TaxID=112863 RepID=UPI00293E97B2|nr:pentatricopeptide repeat-containing protein At5g66520-like isoform X1 [Lycium barbarum]XP_060197272.1 pentatricopeptide repeat-containing protein At5g66520-like isoform X1 [Lycium barbarum]XP_060197273.1 pentatricopeptide repeat-containing protein At5g66520-like isoform X1 [Lycium barbarum]
MISHQIEALFQRSNTTIHLLQLHSLFIKTALNHDEYRLSQFISFSSTISLQFSRKLFDNSPITPPIFAWNTMMRAYSKQVESLKLFNQLQRIRLKADKFTFPVVLKACGHCLMIGTGGSLHSMAFKCGFSSDLHVNNTLLRMYAGFGAVSFARLVFDEMLDRDVVSWSSMMAAYVHCNLPSDALLLFQSMKLANEKPNSISLVSLLGACSRILSIRLGRCIHSYIVTGGMELHVELETALPGMYAKCGHIEQAFRIFNSMDDKNLQTWTIMISGLADHGHGEEAVSLFARMEEAGFRPDSLSFSAILNACSHIGLVDVGREYFEKMVSIYNIRPTMEHYGCMVDMFGRAGELEAAYDLIRSMPIEPNSVILRSFISACNHHGRIPCTEENIRGILLKIEPDLGSNYVLASSLSVLFGYCSDANSLRSAMKAKGIKKFPGSSWVQSLGTSSEHSS